MVSAVIGGGKTLAKSWVCAVFAAAFAASAVAQDLPDDDGAYRRLGAEYFSNVELTAHTGETLRFYDDMLAGRTVAINFIYTSCRDVCPAETAVLRAMQERLSDRIGEDLFMYSISIDPEVDTPERLAEYAELFDIGPGWLFLTGDLDDINMIQSRLGVASTEEDDLSDHATSVIMGSVETGQWIRRSPYENPNLLANVFGGFLDGHRNIRAGESAQGYVAAERIERYTSGERIFRTRCSACHTIGLGGDLGPDLLRVTERRDHDWLARWLIEPDVMFDEGDPVIVEMVEDWDGLLMPNLGLNRADADAVIEYMASETDRALSMRIPGSQNLADAHAGHAGHGDAEAEAPAGHDSHAGHETHAGHDASGHDAHAEHDAEADAEMDHAGHDARDGHDAHANHASADAEGAGEGDDASASVSDTHAGHDAHAEHASTDGHHAAGHDAHGAEMSSADMAHDAHEAHDHSAHAEHGGDGER